jgi:tetratricopeptide (TPR) repeat protein
VGRSKPAGLFALLATSPGYLCGKEEVIAALWPADKPPTDNTVERVVSDLRHVLGDDVLPRRTGRAFLLRPPEGSLDLVRFRDRVDKARRLRGREQFEKLSAALEEWQGDVPLLGFDGQVFEQRKAQLQKEWREAVYCRLAAAWYAREEKWLREESEKLHRRWPEDERFFASYLRTHGLEMPDSKLNSVVRRWTRKYGDIGTEVRAVLAEIRGTSPRPRPGVLFQVPNQLLAPPRQPLGREEVVRILTEHVRRRQETGVASVVLLSGLPGVGKSLLASHLAHQLRDRFPDGVLYENLKGFAGDDVRPVEPEQVLTRFLRELAPQAPVTGLAAQSAALRSALTHRSVLIVLDDAASAEQVLPLLPGTGTSAVIVTSRKTLDDLRSRQDVHLHTVGPLSDAAALELLQNRYSVDERNKYAADFATLARLCGNLPLALTVIERRLDHRPVHALRGLVRDLEEERKKLRALHLPDGELSVLTALSYSARALSEEARRLLWQLAVHPGPTISWEATMDLGTIGGAGTDHAIEELCAANLVELQMERYRLHDLVRAYARHELEPDASGAPTDFKAATVQRVLDHQLHQVRACDRLLDAERRLPIDDRDDLEVISPESPERAMALLDEEYRTVLSCIDLADKLQLHEYIWLLPTTLITYQWRRGYVDDALRYLQRARSSAEEHARPLDCALFHRMLSGTYWRLEKFDAGAACLRRAVRLSEEDVTVAGRESLARSYQALASTLRKQGEGLEAEHYHGLALDLYRELRDPVGEAAALNGLGTLRFDRAEYEEGLRVCGEALAVTEAVHLRERPDVLDGRADILYTLAKIHQARDERDEADSLYRQAAGIYRRLDHWAYEAKVLSFHAELLVAVGRTSDAVEILERVLLLRERMGGLGVQEVRERLEALR